MLLVYHADWLFQIWFLMAIFALLFNCSSHVRSCIAHQTNDRKHYFLTQLVINIAFNKTDIKKLKITFHMLVSQLQGPIMHCTIDLIVMSSHPRGNFLAFTLILNMVPFIFNQQMSEDQLVMWCLSSPEHNQPERDAESMCEDCHLKIMDVLSRWTVCAHSSVILWNNLSLQSLHFSLCTSNKWLR